VEINLHKSFRPEGRKEESSYRGKQVASATGGLGRVDIGQRRKGDFRAILCVCGDTSPHKPL